MQQWRRLCRSRWKLRSWWRTSHKLSGWSYWRIREWWRHWKSWKYWRARCPWKWRRLRWSWVANGGDGGLANGGDLGGLGHGGYLGGLANGGDLGGLGNGGDLAVNSGLPNGVGHGANSAGVPFSAGMDSRTDFSVNHGTGGVSVSKKILLSKCLFTKLSQTLLVTTAK